MEEFSNLNFDLPDWDDELDLGFLTDKARETEAAFLTFPNEDDIDVVPSNITGAISPVTEYSKSSSGSEPVSGSSSPFPGMTASGTGNSSDPSIVPQKSSTNSSKNVSLQALPVSTPLPAAETGPKPPKRRGRPAKVTGKKSSAAISRESREKRKREYSRLKERNAYLLDEKHKFLDQISILQTEVQGIRSSNHVDLERENELLRAEVMQHKMFISDFKRFMSAHSEFTSTSTADSNNDVSKSRENQTTENALNLEQAQQRLLRHAAVSATEQLVNLMMTSALSKHFRRVKMDESFRIKIYYQNLPLGSTAKTSNRLLCRLEAVFDHPIDVVQNTLAGFIENHATAERLYRSTISIATKVNKIERIAELNADHGLPYPTTCQAVVHQLQDLNCNWDLVLVSTEQKRLLNMYCMDRETELKIEQGEEIDRDMKPREAVLAVSLVGESSYSKDAFEDAEAEPPTHTTSTTMDGWILYPESDNSTRVVVMQNMTKRELLSFGKPLDLSQDEIREFEIVHDDDTASKWFSGAMASFNDLEMLMRIQQLKLSDSC